MARVADWAKRQQPQTVDGSPQNGNGAAALPADPLEVEQRNLDIQIIRQRKRAQLEREAQAIEEEREAAETARKIRLERQTRALEEMANGGGGRDSAAVDALRDIVGKLGEDRAALLTALQQTQTQLVTQMNDSQRAQVSALEARVANLQQPTAADPITQILNYAKTMREIREATESAFPAPPLPVQIDPALSRHDALERLKIEGEVQVRTLEAQGNLEAARAQREHNRMELEARSKRIGDGFEALREILGPALGNQAAKRLGGLFGGAEEIEAAADVAPAMQSFPCPRCQGPITVAATANSVICPRCKEMLIRPGTQHPPVLNAPPPATVDRGPFADV